MKKLLALLLLLHGVAAADKKADKKKDRAFTKAYNAGQDAFNLADYPKAAAEFAVARDLAPDKPGPWRWLGRVARVRENWEECATATTQALRLTPDSPMAAEVKLDRDVCREKLGRLAYKGEMAPTQGAVLVVSTAGAKVFVDGLAKGTLPLEPFPLNVGRRAVRVEIPGYETAESVVEVLAGVTIDVVVHLTASERGR